MKFIDARIAIHVALMHQKQNKMFENVTSKQVNKLEHYQEPKPQFIPTFPQIKYLDEFTHTQRIYYINIFKY